MKELMTTKLFNTRTKVEKFRQKAAPVR